MIQSGELVGSPGCLFTYYNCPSCLMYGRRTISISNYPMDPLLEDLGEIDLDDIHWVIVGGESGPGARPMCEEWIRNIRTQCQIGGIPFFFKQWGGVRKSETGRTLDGKTYDEFPVLSGNLVADHQKRAHLLATIANG